MDSPASHCLSPVAGPQTRLLILGSLPGVRSLELRQYYGHPRNHFWPLLSRIVGADLPSLRYEARLDRLQAHDIGLWDVVAQAVRPGSLDQHMRAVLPNSLAGFVAGLPRLEAIAFNGTTAARLGRRELESDGDFAVRAITLIDLPSTSPANTMPIAHKAEAWLRLTEHVTAPADPAMR